MMTPAILENWLPDFAIEILSIIYDLLLTLDFDGRKFGMLRTAADRDSSLFKVISWFGENVVELEEPFNFVLLFLEYMEAASKAFCFLIL